MRQANRNLRRLSPGVAALLVLGACSSEAVNSVSPPRTVTASAPLETANASSDRTSLIFRGDAGATLEDSALVLALFNLPAESPGRNLIPAAGILLDPEAEPIATELDPQPNNDNSNFVSPAGVQLADVAAIFVTSKLENPGTDDIAFAINRLLGTSLSGTGDNNDIVSIPGGGAAPTPDPGGTPGETPDPDPTADPADVASVLAGEPCNGVCDLNGTTELAGVELPGINLNNADLRGADLKATNLSNAQLNAAQLDRADLQGANLTGVNLTDARFRRAQLQGADLTSATLANATATNLQASNAILVGVNAPNFKAGDSGFVGADLSNGNFQGAGLQTTNFDG
ncbi:MAG: pentapeptide repeat-containing protein, partial [Cyanobacteria bacterium J06648_11]